MKTKSLSFEGIRNALSRKELKEIMAGSGGGGGGGGGTGCPIACAPNCVSSIVVYCHGGGQGYLLGTTTAYTCNAEGQLQACFAAGYSTTASTLSDCTC
jgi:hypothetical protein